MEHPSKPTSHFALPPALEAVLESVGQEVARGAHLAHPFDGTYRALVHAPLLVQQAAPSGAQVHGQGHAFVQLTEQDVHVRTAILSAAKRDLAKVVSSLDVSQRPRRNRDRAASARLSEGDHGDDEGAARVTPATVQRCFALLTQPRTAWKPPASLRAADARKPPQASKVLPPRPRQPPLVVDADPEAGMGSISPLDAVRVRTWMAHVPAVTLLQMEAEDLSHSGDADFTDALSSGEGASSSWASPVSQSQAPHGDHNDHRMHSVDEAEESSDEDARVALQHHVAPPGAACVVSASSGSIAELGNLPSPLSSPLPLSKAQPHNGDGNAHAAVGPCTGETSPLWRDPHPELDPYQVFMSQSSKASQSVSSEASMEEQHQQPEPGPHPRSSEESRFVAQVDALLLCHGQPAVSLWPPPLRSHGVDAPEALPTCSQDSLRTGKPVAQVAKRVLTTQPELSRGGSGSASDARRAAASARFSLDFEPGGNPSAPSVPPPAPGALFGMPMWTWSHVRACHRDGVSLWKEVWLHTEPDAVGCPRPVAQSRVRDAWHAFRALGDPRGDWWMPDGDACDAQSHGSDASVEPSSLGNHDDRDSGEASDHSDGCCSSDTGERSHVGAADVQPHRLRREQRTSGAGDSTNKRHRSHSPMPSQAELEHGAPKRHLALDRLHALPLPEVIAHAMEGLRRGDWSSLRQWYDVELGVPLQLVPQRSLSRRFMSLLHLAHQVNARGSPSSPSDGAVRLESMPDGDVVVVVVHPHATDV